jgi:hypothetical protein
MNNLSDKSSLAILCSMQAREAVSQALAALDVPVPDPETKAIASELAEIEERLLAVNKRLEKDLKA